MKKYFVILGLVWGVPVVADTHCKGEIFHMAINRSGTLMVKGPGGLPSTFLCNTETKLNNVEPSACKAMYSALLSAKAQKKSVDITFSPTISSCDEVTAWSYASNVNWVYTVD